MEKEIRNYNGGTFKFRVAPREDISVLEVGYTINLDGEFINVIDGEGHPEVFSEYINKYLGQENAHVLNEILELPPDGIRPPSLDTMQSMTVLTKLNHIVYYGLRPEDVKEVYKQKSNVGYCVILLPEHYEETLTLEQREAVKDLMATNRSIFGNREKVSLHIHVMGEEKEIGVEEFIEKLGSNKSL